MTRKKAILNILIYMLVPIFVVMLDIEPIINLFPDKAGLEFLTMGSILLIALILFIINYQYIMQGFSAIRKKDLLFIVVAFLFQIFVLSMIAKFIEFSGLTMPVSENQQYMETLKEKSFAFIAIIAVVGAPITEEIVFRGSITALFTGKDTLKSQARFITGIVVGAIIFAAVHVSSEMFHQSLDIFILVLLPYITISLVVSYIFYRYQGNIGIVILYHGFTNLVSTVIGYFAIISFLN